MQKTLKLKLLPGDAVNESLLRIHIAQAAAVRGKDVTGFNILKRSIDARGKQPFVEISVHAFINEPWQQRKISSFFYGDVHTATRKVIIVGGGPAGMFAALRLIELGIKPVLLERGKDTRARRRDLALLNKKGIIDPDSNYCFGEGGAGTFSDGKLYTRSTKRGDVSRILNLFVHFGAGENILYDSHPHIGTNKLPEIVTAMRTQIIEAGGEFLFGKKIVDLLIRDGQITGVQTADGNQFDGDSVILSTGHSARDIFQLLFNKKITIECKPFALGVRVEHPQDLVNHIQYHCSAGTCDPFLPPASYSLAEQVNGVGVFSFCMCPGGIIAPAATSDGEVVVNGWSPSKRNNPFANSGIVVQVAPEHVQPGRFRSAMKDFRDVTGMPERALDSALSMMYFQQYVEQRAFHAGGGKFVAPAQRLVDFCEGKSSSNLPRCSYLPGVRATSLDAVLPPLILSPLRHAFKQFGKRMHGYFTNDAVVVAVESRTSSPVRIPRNSNTMQHPQLKNLYPCGEGAGYAGGIVSAAMDGENVATQIGVALGILTK